MNKIKNHTSQKENLFLNIGFNLVLPILFLRKGNDWFGKSLSDLLNVLLKPPPDSTLGPESTLVGSVMLVIAISFPVGYGAWDFTRRSKLNFLSILGAISALFTGGIGLIPGATVKMFAIKEAALPAILGIMTVITLKTKRPLVHLFLFNPEVINVELVNQKLKLNNTSMDFEKLMAKCTWLIAFTFLLSAALNYFLSRMLVVTEPAIDKIAYNDEVGKMMGWSFPIISIPCMIVSSYALWILIKGIKELTGLKFEDAMAQGISQTKKER